MQLMTFVCVLVFYKVKGSVKKNPPFPKPVSIKQTLNKNCSLECSGRVSSKRNPNLVYTKFFFTFHSVQVTRKNNKPKGTCYWFYIHPKRCVVIEHNHVDGVSLLLGPVTALHDRCSPASCARWTSNTTKSQKPSLICSGLLEPEFERIRQGNFSLGPDISFQITGRQQRGDLKALCQ